MSAYKGSFFVSKISTLHPSHSNLGGNGATLLGTYSGNRTIDISSIPDYQNKTFFLNNIMWPYASGYGGNEAACHVQGVINSGNLKLTISGSSILVSGAIIDAQVNLNYGGVVRQHANSSIQYTIYYV